MNETRYAAMQNDCIIAMCETEEEAISVCREEIKKDWFTILCKKKLRKLLKKNRSNIALHRYAVLTITSYKEIVE